VTRRITPPRPPGSAAELAELARGLVARVELPDSTRYRLAGVGLSGFRDDEEDETERSEQRGLFDDSA
jgi:DNA polymerase-4